MCDNFTFYQVWDSVALPASQHSSPLPFFMRALSGFRSKALPLHMPPIPHPPLPSHVPQWHASSTHALPRWPPSVTPSTQSTYKKCIKVTKCYVYALATKGKCHTQTVAHTHTHTHSLACTERSEISFRLLSVSGLVVSVVS